MKNICVIPARMGSSRYPNKPLTTILGIPMLGHVALRCKLEPIFDSVVVATCDLEIMNYCQSIGVHAVMTKDTHERASDRIQEAVEKLEHGTGVKFKTVTMVQGDEPMVTPGMLRLALSGLNDSDAPVVNLMSVISDVEEYKSPNCVKVVVNRKDEALYFSREPIPSAKKVKTTPRSLKQVCVIPFQRDFLFQYSALEPSYLEEVESVDMNRVLEHGYKIKCILIDEESYPVDVPSDVTRVEAALQRCPLVKKYLET